MSGRENESSDRRVAILGAGTMGRAIARGALDSGALAPSQLCATVRGSERARSLSSELGIPVGTDNAAATRGADVVLLCVKPHRLENLVCELRAADALAHAPLLVSIAAGVTTAQLEAWAGAGARVVRAMPNTPCRIGEGMTVLSRGAGVEEDVLEGVERLFRPLGRSMVLDEEYMNAVTGLSASGPAFVYVIIEALAEGGVMTGLPRRVATELAAQCVQGAARMVLETGSHPAELKDQVTTPAGCTISALLHLEDGRLRSVLARGVEEAARTAAGLG